MVHSYRRLEDFFRLDGYQILLQVFNLFAIFTMLSNVVFNVFATAPPTINGCISNGLIFNGTKHEKCEEWIEYGECSDPLLDYEFISVNVEFRSFCGKQEETWLDSIIQLIGIYDKAKFSTTMQMIGLVISCLFIGQLSDMFGRRKVLLVSYSSIFILQLISSFTFSLDTFIISRFALGLFTGAVITVTGIYVIECLPTSYRFCISTIITWAPNYILFALAGYLSQNWRVLSRISAATTLISVIILFFLEESPIFLIQKKRIEDAIKALTGINRFSRSKASPSIIREVVKRESGEETIALLDMGTPPSTEKKKKIYTMFHLYSTRKLAIRTIICSYSSFCLSLITYALMFNMHSIGGSVYLNMLYSGILRYIIGAAVACLDHFGKDRVGRRQLHVITFGCVTLCLIINFVIFMTGYSQDMEMFIRMLGLFAFGLTGCIFLQITVGISELFPTVVRTLASSHINVCGRIANVFGPMVFSMDFGIPGLPYGFLALLGLIDIVLYFVLIPETKGCRLPNAMPMRKLKKVQSAP